jgi:hypothetical protein
MEAIRRARIEEFWARRLGASPAALRARGLQLIPHPLPDAFFILVREASVLASAPPVLHGRLAALDRERLLDRAALLELLPAGARCIGPAFVGYLDVAPDVPGSGLARFASARDPAFDELRVSAAGEEWGTPRSRSTRTWSRAACCARPARRPCSRAWRTSVSSRTPPDVAEVSRARSWPR